jgi:protein gp37
MSDLFHEKVSGNFINEVWIRIINNPRHIFLILTKRPKMLKNWTWTKSSVTHWPIDEIWPDNVWLGVTVEHNDYRNRIDILRQISAAHRFISFEPLLSDIPDVDLTGIDWIIAGGESGPGARPMHPDWARDLR